MKYFKSAAAIAATALFLAVFSTETFAQNDRATASAQSYEVMLQVVTEPGEKSGKADLPDNLAALQKEIKSTFGIPKLRLMNTFIGRINTNGGIGYKGILNAVSGENTRSSFLEWSVANFRVNASDAVPSVISIQSFRFGARVPLTTNVMPAEAGKPILQVSYESIGLNLERVGLQVNQPTLIGTLELPGSNGMVFLVLTVKPV